LTTSQQQNIEDAASKESYIATMSVVRDAFDASYLEYRYPQVDGIAALFRASRSPGMEAT
jgi:hypothetical protein